MLASFKNKEGNRFKFSFNKCVLLNYGLKDRRPDYKNHKTCKQVQAICRQAVVNSNLTSDLCSSSITLLLGNHTTTFILLLSDVNLLKYSKAFVNNQCNNNHRSTNMQKVVTL